MRIFSVTVISLACIVASCGAKQDHSDHTADIQPGDATSEDSEDSEAYWEEKLSELCEMPAVPPEEYRDWTFSIPDTPERTVPMVDDIYEPRRSPEDRTKVTRALVRTSNSVATLEETNLSIVSAGEDVTFHIVFGTNDISDWFRHEVGVMVDYQPVEFEYRRVSRDRTKVLQDGTASWVYDKTQDESWFAYDVTIPAEAFERGRYHEVGIHVRVSDDWWPGRNGISYKASVLYGGKEFPDLPPAVCHFEDSYTSSEDEQLTDFGPHLLTLTGENGGDPMPNSPILVDGGEEVRLKLTVGWSGEVHGENAERRRGVMLPIMNDTPIGDPIWFQDASNEDVQWDTVAYRKYVDIRIPDEPGEYVVRAVGWTWAFSPSFGPSGQELTDANPRIQGDGATNYLEFRVLE